MNIKLPIFLFLLIINGCENYSSDYETQMKVCDKGENLGILDTAVEACQNAVLIAEKHNISPTLLSQSLYKLGGLKRKQGEFIDAEKILSRSISLEKQQNNPDNQLIAVSLLELSLSMAGQNKWDEGGDVMKHLTPLISLLSEKEKSITKNTLKHYQIQLKKSEKFELAKRLNKLATQL